MDEQQETESTLLEYGFFNAMDNRARALIADCARIQVFEAGEFIYREGDAADEFYVITNGTVALEVHVPGRESLVIETIEDGEVLGWSWLVPPHHSRFDARAVGLVRTICIDAGCLREELERDHEIGYQFYRQFLPVVTDRLAAARLQVIDMYGHPRDYLHQSHSVSDKPSKPAKPGPGKRGKSAKKSKKGD